MTIRILHGDCREVLAGLPDASVQCCVTSPPYWGLRDYKIPPTVWGGNPECEHEWGATIAVNATNHTDKARWNHTRNGRDELQPPEKRVSWLRTEVKQGQFCQRCNAWAGSLGLEPTPDLFVEHIVEVFRAVGRVLRHDGTLWLNLGDSYSPVNRGENAQRREASGFHPLQSGNPHADLPTRRDTIRGVAALGIKQKDLIGIPWMVAFALRADGWYLRSDVIWAKPNPMPESVTDRPTSSHEHVFLLTKGARYFYDAEAVREIGSDNPITVARNGRSDKGFVGAKALYETPLGQSGNGTYVRNDKQSGHGRRHAGFNDRWDEAEGDGATLSGRNLRNVWSIATAPFPDAHFATFPPELAERCIKAGSKPGDTILDPFGGAFTTAKVADRLQRHAIGIELNPEYCAIAERRLINDAGMFADIAP